VRGPSTATTAAIPPTICQKSGLTHQSLGVAEVVLGGTREVAARSVVRDGIMAATSGTTSEAAVLVAL
jgi:hypothetical protein